MNNGVVAYKRAEVVEAVDTPFLELEVKGEPGTDPRNIDRIHHRAIVRTIVTNNYGFGSLMLRGRTTAPRDLVSMVTAQRRSQALAAARAQHPYRFATDHDPKILDLPPAAWINEPTREDATETAA